jgi:hypothetical protein
MGRPQIYRTCKPGFVVDNSKNTSRLFLHDTSQLCNLYCISTFLLKLSVSSGKLFKAHFIQSKTFQCIFIYFSHLREGHSHTHQVCQLLDYSGQFFASCFTTTAKLHRAFFLHYNCSQWSWKVNLTVLPYYHCITPSEVSLYY